MGVRYFGTSVQRQEDKRFLTGRGRYVDDIEMVGMLHAGTEVTEKHAGETVESAGVSQLHEISVYLVWLDADIFEEEETAVDLREPWSAGQRGEDREAATPEGAGRRTDRDRAGAAVRHAEGTRAEHATQRLLVVARPRPFAERTGDHGAMNPCDPGGERRTHQAPIE